MYKIKKTLQIVTKMSYNVIEINIVILVTHYGSEVVKCHSVLF